MMQINTITEEEHKDLIESLRNNDCLILNAPLTHLEDGAIESFKSIANTLENHYVNNLPVQYEFTPNENMLSWLSYYDKSQIIGIEVSPDYGLPILYILQIYDGWHKQHKSIVQSQFLEYASQCTAININGSIFNPINCVDAFCDWYIRSNIGSLNFGLTLDINEDNIYCFNIKIKYNFIQRVHTPQVLEEHLGEFFNEKAQKYLLPISIPHQTSKEIEVEKKVNVGRPLKDEPSKKWQKDLCKEYQRLINTNDNTIKVNKAKEILVNVKFKDKFNQRSYESKIARLNTILRAKSNNN